MPLPDLGSHFPPPGTPLLLSSEVLAALSLGLLALLQTYHLLSVCLSIQTTNIY